MRWLSKRAAWRSTAALLLSACATCASAQISLSTAAGLALKSDPRVKAAEANVTRAQAVLTEVHDAYVPTVGISGGYGKSTGPPLGLPTVFSVSSESLVFNFSQRDKIRAAEDGLASARLSLKDAQAQVEDDVAVTYVSLNTAQELRAAMLEAQSYATRLATIVNERVNAGVDTQIDLLQATHTTAQIRLRVLQQEDNIAELEDHLMHLIGLTGKHVETVPNSIPAMPDVRTLMNDSAVSFAVQAAFADANSRRETALGESKYLYRPQISMVGNYSRLNTSPSESNFLVYYPTFAGKSNNDAAIALQIQIPLFDRAHQARTQQASADALHAKFQAESQKNQFLEDRTRLRHSIDELEARSEVASLERDIAKAQLNAVLAQLSANNAATGAPLLTPQDEQSARLSERQRYADYLSAEQELQQSTIHLLRETEQLDAWLNSALHTPSIPPATRITP
jgi:outer membrane protein TolC